MESNTAPSRRRPWGVHSEWRRSSKRTEPGAVRSDQELHFKDKLSPEQPRLRAYRIMHPTNHTTWWSKRVIYGYTTWQGRAEQCPGGTLNNAADRWHLIWMELKPGGGTPTGTLCSMRQYSASGCSRPTELYMVCPWKGEGLYLQLTCVSWTKRIYTQLCILLKCMEMCVYICVCVCVYIYIRQMVEYSTPNNLLSSHI